jgi:hypothetical protein
MFDIQQKNRRRYLFGAVIALTALAGLAGCKNNSPAPIVSTTDSGSAPNNSGADPAAANLAPVDPNSQQVNDSQPQNYASTQQQAPDQQQAPVPCTPAPARTRSFAPAPAATSYNQVSSPAPTEQATQPPPPLPEYQQPPAPAPNDLWTPGYWGYAPTGYYWVPGVWVAAPYVGALWTPPFWGFFGGHYLFHAGYWGPHIGFYGGINYGFGYGGHGYEGGYWHGNNFFYNRSVTRINEVNIHNVYNRTVIVNNYNRVSYNGGRGGVNLRPSLAEAAAMREQHTPPVAEQRELHQQAAQNRQQFFSQNQGHPAQAAFEHPAAARAGFGAAANRPEENHPGAPNAMRGPQPQEQHNFQQQQHEQQLQQHNQPQEQRNFQQPREPQHNQPQEQHNFQQQREPQQQHNFQQPHPQPQPRVAPQRPAPQPRPAYHPAPHEAPHPQSHQSAPHEEHRR